MNGFKIFSKARAGLYSVMGIFMMECGVTGCRKVRVCTQAGKRNGDMKEVGIKVNKMVTVNKHLAMELTTKVIFKTEPGMVKVNSNIMMAENIMGILSKENLMEMQ